MSSIRHKIRVYSQFLARENPNKMHGIPNSLSILSRPSLGAPFPNVRPHYGDSSNDLDLLGRLGRGDRDGMGAHQALRNASRPSHVRPHHGAPRRGTDGRLQAVRQVDDLGFAHHRHLLVDGLCGRHVAYEVRPSPRVAFDEAPSHAGRSAPSLLHDRHGLHLGRHLVLCGSLRRRRSDDRHPDGPRGLPSGHRGRRRGGRHTSTRRLRARSAFSS